MQQVHKASSRVEVPLRIRNPVDLQTTTITVHQDDSPKVKVKVRESDLSTEQNRLSYPVKPELVSKPEKLTSFSMSCLKIVLVLFNCVIWLLGLGVAAVAIWVKSDPSFWTLQLNMEMSQFSTAAIIAAVVGFVIMGVGIIGCYGAIKGNMCLLVMFVIIMGILLILEAVATGIVWAAVNNSKLRDEIKKVTRKSFDNREFKKASEHFINFIQAELRCCGVDGPMDYGPADPPRSCDNPQTTLPYVKGCVDALLEYLKSKATLLGGITIAILLIQFFVIICAICLMCGIRQAAKEIF